LTKPTVAMLRYVTSVLSPQARPFDLAYLAVVAVLLGLLAFFVASVRPFPGQQARPPGRGGAGQPYITPSPAVTPSETAVRPSPSGPQAPGPVPPEVARERCDEAKAGRLAATYGQGSGQGSGATQNGSGSQGSGVTNIIPPAPKPSGTGGLLPLPSLPPAPLPTPSSPLSTPSLKLSPPGLKAPVMPLFP
jgi:hypothetical protein